MFIITPEIINFIRTTPSEVRFLWLACSFVFAFLLALFGFLHLQNRLSRKEEKAVNTAITRLTRRFAKNMQTRNTDSRFDSLEETMTEFRQTIDDLEGKILTLQSRVTDLQTSIGTFEEVLAHTVRTTIIAHSNLENVFKTQPGTVIEFLYRNDPETFCGEENFISKQNVLSKCASRNPDESVRHVFKTVLAREQERNRAVDEEKECEEKDEN